MCHFVAQFHRQLHTLLFMQALMVRHMFIVMLMFSDVSFLYTNCLLACSLFVGILDIVWPNRINPRLAW